MKHKYFIRGFGIGIIFSALLLGLFHKSGNIEWKASDVIAQAEKLGMVFPEEDELDKTLDKLENSKSEPTSTLEPTPTIVPTSTVESTPTAEPTDKPTRSPGVENVNVIYIEILPGMWSGKVAQYLEIMNLVEDEEDFDHFLVKQGYATKIKTGTFAIPINSSYEEIVDIITNE